VDTKRVLPVKHHATTAIEVEGAGSVMRTLAFQRQG